MNKDNKHEEKNTQPSKVINKRNIEILENTPDIDDEEKKLEEGTKILLG